MLITPMRTNMAYNTTYNMMLVQPPCTLSSKDRGQEGNGTRHRHDAAMGLLLFMEGSLVISLGKMPPRSRCHGDGDQTGNCKVKKRTDLSLDATAIVPPLGE